MEDKELKLWKSNSDILALLQIVDKMGWESVRELSIQRILYVVKVLYSFVYPEEENIFQEYSFSISTSGPYSKLVYKSLIDLKSREEIIEDTEGKIVLSEQTNSYTEINKKREDWLKTILYILGLYGESEVFSFTIKDPVYKEAVATNSAKELDTSPENITIQVLNNFKKAFETTLINASKIDKKEYLELYFEYVFSKIIKK